MFQTYQPSGRVSPAFIPWLLVALAVIIAVAFVYQLGLAWIPFIYVSLLLTMALGTAVGMASSRVVKWGKVRNVPASILCLIVLATVGLAAKFGFQYWTARNHIQANLSSLSLDQARTALEIEEQIGPEEWEEYKRTILSNYTFVDHLQDRIDTGWVLGRRGNGAPVAGWFVPLIWLIEAGAVLFIAAPVTLAAVKQPFNEKLGLWADDIETVMQLPITSQEMIDQINAAQSVQELLEIPLPKSDQSNQFAEYNISSVPNAENEDAYLSVELQSYSTNSKGETQVKKTNLVSLAVITAAQRDLLRGNAEILNEAFEAYRASLEKESESEIPAESE